MYIHIYMPNAFPEEDEEYVQVKISHVGWIDQLGTLQNSDESIQVAVDVAHGNNSLAVRTRE